MAIPRGYSLDNARDWQLSTAVSHDLIVEKRCFFVETIGWDTEAQTIDRARAELGAERLYFKNSDHCTVILESEERVFRLSLMNGRLEGVVAGNSHEALAKGLAHVMELFPKTPPPTADFIWLTFHALGPNGPETTRRKISVPEWSEVSDNYPDATRGELGQLMSEFRPTTGGQLLLWHGVPGTGKTWAIRALGRMWGAWCNLEYVVDPEAFFGEAHYMMNTLLKLGDDDNAEEPATPGMDAKLADKDRWNLLILEDTGELLTADAKQRAGQGLSRFLNLVDGLIGQGLRVLLLVTTNEPIGDLHPAVARPGRCAADIEFERFSSDSSLEWLKARTADGANPAIGAAPSGSMTLAELYGQLHGQRRHAKRRQVGFGRS